MGREPRAHLTTHASHHAQFTSQQVTVSTEYLMHLTQSAHPFTPQTTHLMLGAHTSPAYLLPSIQHLKCVSHFALITLHVAHSVFTPHAYFMP